MASADDNDSAETNKGLPFALPSLNQVVCAWIVFVSGSRLFESLPTLTVSTTQNIQLNVALNGALFLGGLFGLQKSLQNVDYTVLDGLEDSSLANQAGAWALAGTVPTSYQDDTLLVATFAGGCFWGTELYFQRIPGVIATCVGYTEGSIDRPNYQQVCSGLTGHTEGIQLLYDPTVCSYERLLTQLFNTIDPTLLNRVGNDRGSQYRHGIYTHSVEQQETATRVLEEVRSRYKTTTDDPIVTEVKPATIFWPAENDHQRYLEKKGQSAEKNCEEKVRCYG